MPLTPIIYDLDEQAQTQTGPGSQSSEGNTELPLLATISSDATALLITQNES